MAFLPSLAERGYGLTPNPTRRIAINTVAPTAARVVDAGFALVYLRVLGEAGTGAFQFLVVFTTYLDTLVDFGLNALVAREVPRAPGSDAAAFRGVGLLRLGLWLVGLPLVAAVYGPDRELANLSTEAALAGWLFYLALLPTVLAKTASGLLWAHERLELTAGVSVLATLLKTGLGVVALFGGLGLLGLASASLITNVVSSTALLALLRMSVPEQPPHADLTPKASHWLGEAWPLFVNQLLQGLFFKVDAVLLPPLAGAAAAGAYAAAYKVSEGAGIVSSSFTLALFPRLSTTRDLASAYRLAVRLLLQTAFPLAAGIALLAEPIAGLVGGRAFLPDAAVALAIVIWYLPLSYANGLTQYVLIAAGRQRWLTGAFVGAFLFNVAANLVLIPRYGFVGAAWVTVASEFVLLVPFRWAAERVATGVSLLAEARAPILATALMAPVVWWLRDGVHPLAASLAGAVVYLTGLWSLGGIRQQHWQLLRSVLRG